MTGEKIKLLLVDDHSLLRDGLRRIFSLHEDMEVVGEAADGQEACALAKAHKPDVVLMDINMPGMNGIEATRQIKREVPEASIIALTIHDDEEYIYELVKAGVSAYILKDIETNALVEAVRKVYRGVF